MTAETESTRSILAAGNRLSTSAARPGDVLFVYHKGPGAWITRLGQRAIRAIFAPGRPPAPSRYSHVALATNPGVLLHADGKRTLFQVMRDVLPSTWPGAGIRIARLVDPGLSPVLADRLVAAAARFDRQPYSFGYGGRSTSFGRRVRWMWAGDGKRTLPFCSELVATAYASVGVVIGRLPPDRILPMDLDEACCAPTWRDVTDEYYPTPLPTHFPDGTPLGVDLDFDPHGEQMADILVALANARFDSVAGWESLHESSDALRDFNWQTTAAIIAEPAFIFVGGPSLPTSQLARLETAYALIEGYPETFSAPGTAPLRELFPHLHPDEAPFEAQTTLEGLAQAEQRHDVDTFVTILLRGQALLEALGSAFGETVTAPERFKDLDPEVMAKVLQSLPVLTRQRADELRAAIDRMVASMGKSHALAIARDVVELHYCLTSQEPPLSSRPAAPPNTEG